MANGCITYKEWYNYCINCLLFLYVIICDLGLNRKLLYMLFIFVWQNNEVSIEYNIFHLYLLDQIMFFSIEYNIFHWYLLDQIMVCPLNKISLIIFVWPNNDFSIEYDIFNLYLFLQITIFPLITVYLIIFVWTNMVNSIVYVICIYIYGTKSCKFHWIWQI